MYDTILARALLAALAACTTAGVSTASFTSAVVPPFRGAPCTEYAGWESFSSAHLGQNLPDDPASSSGDAVLVQLTPGAILTGGGNLYHPGAATSFRLTERTAGDLQEVIVQTSTLGNFRDQASFRLAYVDDAGARQELLPVEINVLAQGAQTQELYVRWDLSAVPELVFSFEVLFQAAASSMSLDALLLDVRYDCFPATPFCFGDGLDLAQQACPCGNAGFPGHGCAISGNTHGARLVASGSTAPDALVLTASGELATALSIFLQGDTQIAAAPFGDGLRCAGGSLKRLYVKNAVAGVVAAPTGSDPSISARSAALGDPFGPGAIRYYQVYARDPDLGFCPQPSGNSFNVSNGLAVQW